MTHYSENKVTIDLFVDSMVLTVMVNGCYHTQKFAIPHLGHTIPLREDVDLDAFSDRLQSFEGDYGITAAIADMIPELEKVIKKLRRIGIENNYSERSYDISRRTVCDEETLNFLDKDDVRVQERWHEIDKRLAKEGKETSFLGNNTTLI